MNTDAGARDGSPPRTHRWPLVLTFSNRKGGVAKSSCVFHLGYAFAQRGLRTLWIDADPQGSLTQMFIDAGRGERYEHLKDEHCLTALFAGLGVRPRQLVWPTGLHDNLHIVWANDNLSDWNHARPEKYPHEDRCLAQFAAELAGEFDLILIDTPPNLQMLTWAAMVASDAVVTPFEPEDFGAQGLFYVHRFIGRVRELRNPELRWAGLVKTMFQPRLLVHQSYSEDAEAAALLYQTRVLPASLPLHAAFKVAVWAKKPLPLHAPKCAGARAVQELAVQIAAACGLALADLPAGKKPRGKKAEAA